MRLLIAALLLGSVTLPADLLFATAAHAQSALCPTSINVQGGDRTGFALDNGACTNRVNAGAFSGAALATQALSDLSQSTTQETNRNAAAAVADRREAERERCAPGLVRVNGICQRPAAIGPVPALRTITPSRSERRARVEPEATPVPRRATPVSRARVEPKQVAAPKRAPSLVTHRAPDTMQRERPYRSLISKDESVPVLPFLPFTEGPRFAAWATGFGDYERREGRGTSNIQCCFAVAGVPGGLPNLLALDVRSSATTAGFTGGLDVTGRNLLQSGDGVIAGVLTGYIATDLSITTRSLSSSPNVGNGFGQLRANLSGPSLGYFTTYFNGPFSADFTYKADMLSLDERFGESLAFVAQPTAIGQSALFFGGGRASLTTHSLIGNANYRFPITATFWIEPTAGIQYSVTNYGSGANRLGLDNGDLFRVQGGVRVGTTFETANAVLMTASLSGLAYENVFINGGFLQGVGFEQSNILVRADEGKVRGLGILNISFDHRNGFTWFVQGSVRGGENLFGAGGKAGVRYQW